MNLARRQLSKGKLWNCSDFMPSDLCAELEIEQGSTFGQAVQITLIGRPETTV